MTLIAYGAMVAGLRAGGRRARCEVSCEVVDIRSLRPLDEEAILASVAKTGRVVIVHEAPRTAGFGAELAALIAEQRDLRPAGAGAARDGLRRPVSVLVDRGLLRPVGRARRRGRALALVLSTRAERLRLWLERDRPRRRATTCATRRPASGCAGRIRAFASSPSRASRSAPRRSPMRRSTPARASRSCPSPTNEHDPNAVGVWNEERTLQAGYVPREWPRRWRATSWRVALARRRGPAHPARPGRRLDRAPRR